MSDKKPPVMFFEHDPVASLEKRPLKMIQKPVLRMPIGDGDYLEIAAVEGGVQIRSSERLIVRPETANGIRVEFEGRTA